MRKFRITALLTALSAAACCLSGIAVSAAGGADASALCRYLRCEPDADTAQYQAWEQNGDSVLDARDLTLIKRALLTPQTQPQ